MAVWGRKYLPVTEELAIRARLLEEGGPKLWRDFADELRVIHLGAPKRRGAKPVTARLRAAYEAVVARRKRSPATR